MAKKPSQVVEEQRRKVAGMFKEFAGSSKRMQGFADDLTKRIVTRTRLGSQPTKSGGTKKFDRLSNSYIKQRKGQIRFYTNTYTGNVFVVDLKKRKGSKSVTSKKSRGSKRSKSSIPKSRGNSRKSRNGVKNKGEGFKPSKANNTATGLLLRSLKGVGSAGGKLTIELRRVIYSRNMYGESLKKSISTHRVNNYLERMGRKWLDTTRAQDNITFKNVAKSFEKFVSNRLK